MHDLSRYAKKETVEIQSKYVSLLLGGSAALVALVFAVGVLVGSRQMKEPACPSPDPLAALDLQSEEPPPPERAREIDFSFHEALSARPDAIPVPASLLTDGSAEEVRPEEAPETAPLEQPRHDEEPIPEKVRHDEPGFYSLQVGSFQDQREASAMVRRLGRAGHTAFLVSVSMPDRGGKWFRVRVGPFQSKREAWRYKRVFEEKEQLPAFVVKRRS